MKTLLFASIAGVFAMAPGSAIAAIDSNVDGQIAPSVATPFAASTASAMPATGHKTMPSGGNMRGMKHLGNFHQMKKYQHSGNYVRRGRVGYDKSYRRPFRGYRLPQTYIQPSYFIGNFGYYGLSQPSSGYGWSRYYDDAVLTDRYGVVQDARYNVDWDRYNQGYQDGYYAGQATYDESVFVGDDRVTAHPPSYYDDQSTYRGDWNGAYREDGSYQGEWQGTYRDADGQVYEGQYSGTFIGDGNVTPHWGSRPDQGSGCDIDPGYDPRGCGIADGRREIDRGYPAYPDVDSRRSEELAYLERCKKSSGIGGAIVGGAIGALAGNRIAGRGNRLGGTLIGGGLGAVAGAAIDQGTDRCRSLLKKYGYEERRAPVPYRRPYPPQRQPSYPSGWNGYYTPGYYYPAAQQPMVTTIVVQSAPVTTTTTTTYVEEEVVYSKPTYKKRWKPAPKQSWKPATKAVPLKGCQQARCMYD